MQGRIKRGAGIFQDHHFGKWPNCCPPRSEYEGEEYKYEAKDPDMVFEVEWTGRHWDCKADGYGMLRSRGEGGEYGNGSIFVSDPDGVELVRSNVPHEGATAALSRTLPLDVVVGPREKT